MAVPGADGADAVHVREQFDRYKPSELEILAGDFLGKDPDIAALAGEPRGIPPLAALEEVIASCVARPPCLVSFSGGRDSSVILAAAARVARRLGLPPPVPATFCFPGQADTEEGEWQDLVIGHLGLEERVQVTVTDELEAIGPVATSVLRRHGVLVPPNVYFHMKLLELAQGGSLLTGVGGDELFAAGARRLPLVASRRARPAPKDLLRLGWAITPRRLRVAAGSLKWSADYPWLRPGARRWVTREMVRSFVEEPLRWDDGLRGYWSHRRLQGARAVLAGLGLDRDVAVVHPFYDPRFLIELLPVGGATGFANRSEAMRALFTGLLPEQLLTRSTKARFDAAVWGERVRTFARSWAGQGVDAGQVDVELLRKTWLETSGDYRTLLLLQTAWITTESGDHATRDGAFGPMGNDA